MRSLNELLLHLIEAKATDLHLIVGKTPTVRVDGIIVVIDDEPDLTAERFAQMLTEYDLSSGDDVLVVTDAEALDRFRVTVFDIGEGLVARVIPKSIPPLRMPA